MTNARSRASGQVAASWSSRLSSDTPMWSGTTSSPTTNSRRENPTGEVVSPVRCGTIRFAPTPCGTTSRGPFTCRNSGPTCAASTRSNSCPSASSHGTGANPTRCNSATNPSANRDPGSTVHVHPMR
ncbi:hypothetical protein ACFQV2_32755 [Actinokineospora soli]|uniref:Uncharacterized protein n=1 Tax=Actinokineospora soli TaxID=1048753 RepID=A0ABW2TXL5_9PSEU